MGERDEVDNRPEALRRKALVEGWESWLRGIRWDYYATGTWTQPVTAATALRVVRNWLSADPQAYAAIGVQRGPALLKYHVHVLVGGLGRHRFTETRLRGSWVKFGHLKIDGYHPALGGVEYLVQQADEIELVGSPKPFRPRHRAGQGHNGG